MSRLETQVTVPAAGWPVSINDGGGIDVATVPGGTYYVAPLLAALVTALNAATGKTFTVTVSDGSSGTGAITISINTGTFSITWSSTDLRDYLGFTAAVTGAATYTSPGVCQAMWIPKCAMSGADFDPSSRGVLRTDARYSMSGTGRVQLMVGNSYRSFTGIRWSHVSQERSIQGVGTAVNSWERWIRETQWGGLLPFPIVSGEAPPVLVFFKADTDELVGEDDGGDGEYRLVLPPTAALPFPIEGYVGLRTVEVQELVKT